MTREREEPPGSTPDGSTPIAGRRINNRNNTIALQLPPELEQRLSALEQRINALCAIACSPSNCQCPSVDA